MTDSTVQLGSDPAKRGLTLLFQGSDTAQRCQTPLVSRVGIRA